MLRPIALVSAFLVACTALAQDASQTRYAVLIMEKPAGLETSTVAADGTRSLSYEFNDRGRGPKTHTVMKLKDVVDALEAAIDAFETVANIVEQIAVKES